MCHRHRNRGGGSHDGNPVELADGGFSGDDDGTYVTAKTYCVDWYPNRKPYRPLGMTAMAHGGSAVAHGGARPRSGRTGPAWKVASSLERLRELGKTRRGIGVEEGCGGALATVSAKSGEAQPWRAVVEWSQRPYPSSNGPVKWRRRSRGTLRSYGEDVARVSAAGRELGDGKAPRQRWRSG